MSLPLSLLGSNDAEEGDRPALSDYLALKKAYINEKASPELLPFAEELVARIEEQVERQVERINDYEQQPNHELPRTLLQYEVDRAKFLLRAYYRTRVSKIQDNVMQVLDVSEYRARLSDRERQLAQDYFVLVAGHLKHQVLDHLPPGFQSLVRQQGAASASGGAQDTAKDMVPAFKIDKHVLCRVLQDKGAIDTQEDGSETIDLEEGDVVMMRYKLIRDLLEEGSVELM